MAITLDTPLDQFPGVGEARAKKLEKLGLTRCAQLLTYFPRDYEDRREIYSIRSAPLGRKVCVRAMAAEHPRLARIRRGLELVQLRVVDQAGALHLTFFNQSYVERALRAGEEYIFFGMVEEQGSRRAMVNPIFEPADRRNTTGRIIPVYPLTAGISNHLMLSLTQRAVEACAGSAQETLPPSIRLEHGLAPYVTFLIMPVFALANAGVEITSLEYLNIFHYSPEIGSIGMGVFFGLVLGKPLGIFLASWGAVRTGLAELPEGATWRMLLAVACLGGIGFTMSLFVDSLAFTDPDLVDRGKIAILMGSLAAAVVGCLLILIFSGKNRRTRQGGR